MWVGKPLRAWVYQKWDLGWDPPGTTFSPWSGAFDAVQLPWGARPGPGLEGLVSDFLSSPDVLLLVPGQENGLQKVSKGFQVEKLSNGGCTSSCGSTRPTAVPEPDLPQAPLQDRQTAFQAPALTASAPPQPPVVPEGPTRSSEPPDLTLSLPFLPVAWRCCPAHCPSVHCHSSSHRVLTWAFHPSSCVSHSENLCLWEGDRHLPQGSCRV